MRNCHYGNCSAVDHKFAVLCSVVAAVQTGRQQIECVSNRLRVEHEPLLDCLNNRLAAALGSSCCCCAGVFQVFDQLLRRRVTFNAYTYNCLLQLCSSAGCIDDALALYNLQRLETDPANLPDAYTYNALMRGVLVSGRVELTQQVGRRPGSRSRLCMLQAFQRCHPHANMSVTRLQYL